MAADVPKYCMSCGEEAALRNDEATDAPYVGCSVCGLRTALYETATAALAAWNERPMIAVLVSEMRHARERAVEAEARCSTQAASLAALTRDYEAVKGERDRLAADAQALEQLRAIYAEEDNCGLESFWDAGWRAWLGDNYGNGIVWRSPDCDDPREAIEALAVEYARRREAIGGTAYFACGICGYRGTDARHICPPEAVAAMWEGVSGSAEAPIETPSERNGAFLARDGKTNRPAPQEGTFEGDSDGWIEPCPAAWGIAVPPSPVYLAAHGVAYHFGEHQTAVDFLVHVVNTLLRRLGGDVEITADEIATERDGGPWRVDIRAEGDGMRATLGARVEP